MIFPREQLDLEVAGRKRREKVGWEREMESERDRTQWQTNGRLRQISQAAESEMGWEGGGSQRLTFLTAGTGGGAEAAGCDLGQTAVSLLCVRPLHV